MGRFLWSTGGIVRNSGIAFEAIYGSFSMGATIRRESLDLTGPEWAKNERERRAAAG
jgi:hypothetical protein